MAKTARLYLTAIAEEKVSSLSKTHLNTKIMLFSVLAETETLTSLPSSKTGVGCPITISSALQVLKMMKLNENIEMCQYFLKF